jgi:hypothetical protein
MRFGVRNDVGLETMDCKFAGVALLECARSRKAPDDTLEAHLAGCRSCRERWEAERELTSHLRAMRLASVPASIEWSKAVLLREFDAHRRRERQVRWMWAMSSAAVLVLSVVAFRDVWSRPAVVPAVSGGSGMAHALVYPQREYQRETFTPAEEAGEKGFIALPFALPSVPGETFGIVRTQLDPAALARMGVSVDPGWSGTLQADLWVGQDGLPQAVRLSDDNFEEN